MAQALELLGSAMDVASPTEQEEEEEPKARAISKRLSLSMLRPLPKEEEEQEKKVEKPWLRWIKSCDGYGESEDKYDPIAHPKVGQCCPTRVSWCGSAALMTPVPTVPYHQTPAGGVIWIVFRVIFVLLLAWSCYNLAQLNVMVIPGETLTLNVNQNLAEVPEGSKPVMDVPTLELRVGNEIIFYEKK